MEYGIPKEKWIYQYTNDSVFICSKAVGGLAEGCAFNKGDSCLIVLPENS